MMSDWGMELKKPTKYDEKAKASFGMEVFVVV